MVWRLLEFGKAFVGGLPGVRLLGLVGFDIHGLPNNLSGGSEVLNVTQANGLHGNVAECSGFGGASNDFATCSVGGKLVEESVLEPPPTM